MPALAALQFAQEILLRPVEIRLLVHFRTALARRHRERPDMDAIGLRALQQRDVLQVRRDRLERAHQIAQHVVVDAHLLVVTPAVHQIGLFIESSVGQMRGAPQFARLRSALRGVGEIERDETRAIKIARLTPRQRHNLNAMRAAEMSKRRIAHQPRRARDHHFPCHSRLPFLLSSDS